jgi:carboxypeptidase D
MLDLFRNKTNLLTIHHRVDQPIGTGYAIGTPTATTQEETAEDFIKFFKNFETLFGIKNFKIYVIGESYAGRYISYISSAMLDQNDTEYFNLAGALLYDPCIGTYLRIKIIHLPLLIRISNWDFVQQEVPIVPIVPFVQANQNILNFNSTFLAKVSALHGSCGYADWIEKYLVFPASEAQPAISFNSNDPRNASCDLFDTLDHAAFAINPRFDVYAINEQCPLLWDVLSHRTQFNYIPDGATVHPNRTDVKEALRVPANINWVLDNPSPVYVRGSAGPEMAGDTSADPIQYVLPRVIEATGRVLVSNGDLDIIILTNGTLLAIQNMTWNGALGFQTCPSTPIVIDLPDLQYKAVFDASGQKGRDDPQGAFGVQHYERGLMWAETYLGGHTQPGNQPRASYRHLEWLLGYVDVL